MGFAEKNMMLGLVFAWRRFQRYGEITQKEADF